MKTSDWIELALLLVTALPVMYFIIMTAVDRKIAIAFGKMRDEQIKELKEENRRKEERIDQLKDRIKDMK